MAAGFTTKVVGDGNSGTFSGRFSSPNGTDLGPAPVLSDMAGAEVLGQLTASPTQNSLLDRTRRGWAGFQAVGQVLTRTSGVVGYVNQNSISNSATPASVSAFPVTIPLFNDQPFIIDSIRLDTNDTGSGGKMFRIHIFQSDPTLSSGVIGGDHATWNNKRAGYCGSFSGTLKTLSDGGSGRFIPDEIGDWTMYPGTSSQTLWWQLQALSDFTPVSLSTWTPTFYGKQLQA